MIDPSWPLTLNEDADEILIGYLQERENFPYLGRSSRSQVKKLTKTADLRAQSDTLKKLWPHVLTDSLKELKTHDTRECPRDMAPADKKRYVNTFFHENSLGVTELTKILTGFTDFEGMLYGLSPDRYRDHVAHAFRVWILGHMLLDERLCWDLDPGDPVHKTIQREEWQCMWAIASLCHDIGYPLAAIKDINEQARSTFRILGLVPVSDLKFAFSQQMLPFHDTIIRLMASKPVCVSANNPQEYLTHVQNKYYLKFLKSFDNLAHGVLSALLISKALVYFLESDFAHDGVSPLDSEDARQFLMRREILRAIAAHTCPDIYHLKFNTLSFMLYIVDELQCWGRPTMEEMSRSSGNLGKATVKLSAFSPERITIRIKTSESKWVREHQDRVVHQLDKLHRMLRLAVGTRELERLRLCFQVRNKREKAARFLLEKGKITKTPKSWFKRKRDGA